MALTFSTLITDVSQILERDSAIFVAAVPSFISKAEDRINLLCDTIGFEVYVDSAFTIGRSVIQKPGRWRRTVKIEYGNGGSNNYTNVLEPRDEGYMRMYWPDDSLKAPPKYYCEFGFYNMLILPTPDQAYPFRFSYIETPPELTINNQRNWLTDFAPDLITQGTLYMMAAQFLKDPDLAAMYKEQFQECVNGINKQNIDRATARTRESP